MIGTGRRERNPSAAGTAQRRQTSRGGRQEVAAPDSTVEAGLGPEDPGEGARRQEQDRGGNMTQTSDSEIVSTRQRRIAVGEANSADGIDFAEPPPRSGGPRGFQAHLQGRSRGRGRTDGCRVRGHLRKPPLAPERAKSGTYRAACATGLYPQGRLTTETPDWDSDL